MMKVVLFALVCISFAHVYGEDITMEEDIKNALKRVESFHQFLLNYFEHTKQDYVFRKNHINSEVTKNIKSVTSFNDESVYVIKNMSQAFVKIAKDEKRPESVIKCITTEESLTIARIKTATNKYVSDAKKLSAEKLGFLTSLEQEVKKLEESYKLQYKKNVEEIKKSETIDELFDYLGEYEFFGTITNIDLEHNGDKRVANQLKFDTTLYAYTINVNAFITTTKNLAVKNMRTCWKNKTA